MSLSTYLLVRADTLVLLDMYSAHTHTHTRGRPRKTSRERERSHTQLQLKHRLWFHWSLQTETGSTIFTDKLFLASFCFFSGGSSSLATQRLWELQLRVNTENNTLSIHIHTQPDRLVCGSTPPTDDRPQLHRLVEFWEITRQRGGRFIYSVSVANDRLSQANAWTDGSTRGPQGPDWGPAVTHKPRRGRTEPLQQPGWISLHGLKIIWNTHTLWNRGLWRPGLSTEIFEWHSY